MIQELLTSIMPILLCPIIKPPVLCRLYMPNYTYCIMPIYEYYTECFMPTLLCRLYFFVVKGPAADATEAPQS
jgi:hypothetical protein